MIFNRNFEAFKQLTVSRGVWSVVLSGVLISGSCWLSAADESPLTGLRGILPATVPADLTATIAALPENWKAWGTAVSAELAALYETEGVDVAGQRKAIAALRGRLTSVNSHAADPRYKGILPTLVSLSGGLKRRLDTAEAALDTLERGPEARSTKIVAASRHVAQEAQTVNTYLNSIRNGAGWLKYLQVSDVNAAAAANDAEKTTAILASAQSRFKSRDTLADARAREFLAKPEFAAYEESIDGYLAAVTAPTVAANNPDLRKNLAALFAAVEEYESTRASSASAAVRKAFDGVRATAPDAGDGLAHAMRNNYFNYNLRVVASEAFLNKFVGQSRDETGPVVDYILGADVRGTQATHTDVSIDLVPSGNTAQFDLTANGSVAASTAGYTSQATIFTNGNHHFTAMKRISFDGDRFWTQPARINVTTNNTTTGADTHMGFLSGFANGIAVRKAEGMRGESEAIAAGRLQERVLPEFNLEVDKEFGPNGKANPEFEKTVTGLRELNLYPDAKSWSTTDTELKVATRLMAATELGGSDANPALVLGRGATILLHESVMNNAADRLDLAGKTFTEEELKAKLEENFSKLLGREVKFKKDEKPAGEGDDKDDSGPKTFVFDKTDPIRVQVSDGTLVLTLRAGFKQEGKEDIPTQIISVPLQFSVNMKNVVIDPGEVAVAAAEPAENAGKQFTRAGVIKKKIGAALPRREIDRVSYLNRDKKRVQIAVTRIRALDGWLSITVE